MHCNILYTEKHNDIQEFLLANFMVVGNFKIVKAELVSAGGRAGQRGLLQGKNEVGKAKWPSCRGRGEDGQHSS